MAVRSNRFLQQAHHLHLVKTGKRKAETGEAVVQIFPVSGLRFPVSDEEDENEDGRALVFAACHPMPLPLRPALCHPAHSSFPYTMFLRSPTSRVSRSFVN